MGTRTAHKARERAAGSDGRPERMGWSGWLGRPSPHNRITGVEQLRAKAVIADKGYDADT